MSENKNIRSMMAEEQAQLDKLQQIVQDTIKEEALIINNLLNPPSETLSRGQKISDKVARFGGSWQFIISFGIILCTWISYNVIALQAERFDPYPFILLNLILSCVAALQAPIIMMSQNRQEEKDRKRSENDYLINLKAEIQIRSLHQKMDLLIQDQLKDLFNVQARQLKMLEDIQKKMNHRA